MVKQPITKLGAPCRAGANAPLSLVSVNCCICDLNDVEPVGVGEDFEYRTSPDTFLAVRCRNCGLIYTNPRPAMQDLSRIYPPDYHAFEFSAERYGFVYQVRQKLEARRLLSCCKGLGKDARIIDVGCGDGFHLNLLKKFGQPSWQLEGVDPSDRAVEAGTRKGLKIHHGIVQDLVEDFVLPQASYDLAFMIATIEHVDDPSAVLTTVRSLLKPGGKVIIVTDNTDTLDFQLFKTRHWGGYHFPRHWNLFNPNTIRALAQKTLMEVDTLTTVVSPVNWVYSIRNTLVDWQAPKWLVERFSLNSTFSLGIFTLFDMLHQWMGRGALIRATLRRPL
ncbi:MAG: class I SAM-dependent methyltransferase [Drouetiella hepatica Uher 2000/2452]|uniref:Class I SAM-dependent methyltransferase n=1 Tax=Drouetiella hepatica Uher 2000/2452 TaxID=904376 RepID=A0A951UNW9_9CYAN|nr:class I SAM-dependent methyltransferase [Drouetiella hepatica Uher 2000/2452]